jgi:predicted permease
MLYLFTCIAIGFALRKFGAVPDNSGPVLAKLENWVFCPALSFMTAATYFKVDNLALHGMNIILSCVIATFALVVAIILSRYFIREKVYNRGVYAYALMFGNFGFVGDPLVIAMFGDEFFAYYKLFTLPLSILCYVWGISVLVPKEYCESGAKGLAKRILTPPTVALFIGIIIGLTDTLKFFPEFMITSLDALKGCMGPVAMILAGITIAGFDIKDMLTNKKVYLATLFRLTILPALLVALAYGIISLINHIFSSNIEYFAVYLTFFAYATPLGMNTIVFPQAYGGDPKTGAAMAMISHTLCVISIPIMYTLLTQVLGSPL